MNGIYYGKVLQDRLGFTRRYKNLDARLRSDGVIRDMKVLCCWKHVATHVLI